MPVPPSLLRPMFALVGRSALGIAMSVGGTLLLTRQVGPEGYGAYAGAVAIVTFLTGLAHCGTATWLLRRGERSADDAAATFVVTVGICLAALVALVRLALPDTPMIALLPIIATGMPVALLAMVYGARLERDLAFSRVAAIEIAAQAAFYALALPLVSMGAREGALVAGWWAWQSVTFAGLAASTRWWPRWRFDARVVRDILAFGSAFSASSLIWQARQLVNPIVVGGVAGEAGVGHVALALRLVEAITFAKSAFWRLSLAAFARMRSPGARRRLLIDATLLEVVAVGACLVGASLLVLPLLPSLLGERWDVAIALVPWLGMAMLANAVFNLQCANLTLQSRFGALIRFHAVHVVLLAAGAAVLVPRLGVMGYAVAELIAILGHLTLLADVRGILRRRDLLAPVLIAAALAAAALQPQVGWIAFAPLVVALLAGAPRRVFAAVGTLRAARA